MQALKLALELEHHYILKPKKSRKDTHGTLDNSVSFDQSAGAFPVTEKRNISSCFSEHC